MRRAILAVLVCLVCAPGVASAQTGTPRREAIVLHVVSPPLLTTTGTANGESSERLRVLRAAINAMLDLDVAITVAPSPVLLQELETLAARDVLAQLRTMAARGGILAGPYANVRLTDLDDDEIEAELDHGAGVIERVLDRGSAAVFPPGPALDRATADAVEDAGYHVPPALRNATIVTTPSIDFTGTVDPSSQTIVDIVPLSELDGAGRFQAAPDDADPAPRSYERALADARRSVTSFLDYTVPGNPLRRVFEIAFGRAMSSLDADWERLEARADAVVQAATNERRKFTVDNGGVTFTSKDGSVPVTVTNAANYPIRARLTVSSSKLDFPDGPARVVTIEPPGRTVTFAALARSSGTFPVEISLTSPSGSIALDRGELSVRSTAFNIAALILTAGGALFLLIWFARRKRPAHA